MDRLFSWNASWGSNRGVVGVDSSASVLVCEGLAAKQASESKVVEFVEQIAPLTPSGRGLLDRLLQDWPRVPTFGSTGLPVDVGEPPEELTVSAETLARVADSVLRVQAIACSQRQDGTAFVVSPGVALTNAHVVAGSGNIEIAAPEPTALRQQSLPLI